VDGPDPRLAVGAVAGLGDDVARLGLLQRQPVDEHVEEGAHHQAEGEEQDREGQGGHG